MTLPGVLEKCIGQGHDGGGAGPEDGGFGGAIRVEGGESLSVGAHLAQNALRAILRGLGARWRWF